MCSIWHTSTRLHGVNREEDIHPSRHRPSRSVSRRNKTTFPTASPHRLPHRNCGPRCPVSALGPCLSTAHTAAALFSREAAAYAPRWYTKSALDYNNLGTPWASSYRTRTRVPPGRSTTARSHRLLGNHLLLADSLSPPLHAKRRGCRPPECQRYTATRVRISISQISFNGFMPIARRHLSKHGDRKRAPLPIKTAGTGSRCLGKPLRKIYQGPLWCCLFGHGCARAVMAC